MDMMDKMTQKQEMGFGMCFMEAEKDDACTKCWEKVMEMAEKEGGDKDMGGKGGDKKDNMMDDKEECMGQKCQKTTMACLKKMKVDMDKVDKMDQKTMMGVHKCMVDGASKEK